MMFSIIVPIYNVEKYLNECVESLLNQDYKDYEIILVNDGSKDNSALICDKFANKYESIKVIHKVNGGLSDARNAGVSVAKGEYILFVDGDDQIYTNSLGKIKTVIDQSKADIICLELDKFFDNDSKIIPMKDGIDSSINNLTGDALYFYLSNLPKYPASACTKAIKRELFLKNDLLFEKGLLSEDLEWCIRLFLAANSFTYCDVPYYLYRQGRVGSISNTPSAKKTKDIMNTLNKWVQYANGIDDIAKKTMIYSYMEYIFRLIVLGYKTLDKNDKKKIRELLKKNEMVFGIRRDKVSKAIWMAYKMFGLTITSRLLSMYLNLRKY